MAKEKPQLSQFVYMDPHQASQFTYSLIEGSPSSFQSLYFFYTGHKPPLSGMLENWRQKGADLLILKGSEGYDHGPRVNEAIKHATEDWQLYNKRCERFISFLKELTDSLEKMRPYENS